MTEPENIIAKCQIAVDNKTRTFYMYKRDNGGLQEYVVHTNYSHDTGLCNGGYYDDIDYAWDDFQQRINNTRNLTTHQELQFIST